ncbi:MAG: glycosyltransferase [Phycisphaerales bacterium]|nr:glycosyltransferase [Phycisphaerales bacterium]
MARLIVLPVSPLGKGGYNTAVADDVSRLGQRDDDFTIIYPHPGQPLPDGVATIARPSKLSPLRFWNTLRLRTTTETTVAQIRAATGNRTFDEIFCGETTFYRSLRAMYPNQRMDVRFHNFFSLPRCRQEFRKYRIDPVFRLNLAMFARLEREICRDPLADPILIAHAERDFLQLQYPGRNIRVWNPPIEVAKERKAPTVARLAYMGSLAHHQRDGMRYFIEQVMPALRANRPDIEFHMYGNGSEQWNNPQAGVHGHGFYDGEGFPLDGDALFICPDLLGGGIKIKVGDWLSWGLPFVTTRYGLDGYDLPELENVVVSELDEWAETIPAYFDQVGARNTSDSGSTDAQTP